jgi:polyhydroxyalkanoate synthesis repressor PhaR
MAKPLILKKYGNRRLYDAERSGYVTLSEVEKLVRQGRDVQVIDAKSGEDLTKSVLVQIILEEEGARQALPAAFLKQVIRMSQSPVKDQFSRMLSAWLDAFEAANANAAQSQHNLAAQMQRMFMAPLSMLQNPFAMFAPPPPAAQAAPAPPEPPRAAPTGAAPADLDLLRQQLAETQAQVAALLKATQGSAGDD